MDIAQYMKENTLHGNVYSLDENGEWKKYGTCTMLKGCPSKTVTRSNTCKDCANFIGGGDWNLCCTVKQGYWLCYEDTEACEKFVEKGKDNEASF